jgi:hypothetical protein
MERRPITIEGRKVDPPPAGANPRQVYDFFLLGLALCPQVKSEIAAQLVDAYIRLYPPQYDSSAGGARPYTPPPW